MGKLQSLRYTKRAYAFTNEYELFAELAGAYLDINWRTDLAGDTNVGVLQILEVVLRTTN
jgi:hypothetical protein